MYFKHEAGSGERPVLCRLPSVHVCILNPAALVALRAMTAALAAGALELPASLLAPAAVTRALGLPALPLGLAAVAELAPAAVAGTLGLPAALGLPAVLPAALLATGAVLLVAGHVAELLQQLRRLLLVESNVIPQQASTKRPVEAAVPPRHPAGERGGSGWQGNSRGRPAGQRTVDGNAWSGPEGSSPTSTDTQKPNTDCVVNA